MTRDQFLREFRRVARLPGWGVRGTLIRRLRSKSGIVERFDCPITAVANAKRGRFAYTTNNFIGAADYLGLEKREAERIANAADKWVDVNNPNTWPRKTSLRYKLEKIVGLRD